MTELRELLERAVVPPSAPPDLGSIARRVRTRRRLRMAKGTATTVLVAAAVFAAVSARPGPVTPQIVGSLDPPAVESSPGPSVADPDAEPGAKRDTGSTVTAPQGDTPPVTSTAMPYGPGEPDPGSRAPVAPPPVDTTPTARPSTAPTTPARQDAQPEGCRVEIDQQPCTYVATQRGGYESDGSGDWTITIERDGRTITINGEADPTCGPVGTILPGDRVTVDASRGTAPVILSYGGHSFVAAGSRAGESCS